MLSKELTVTW